MKALRYGFGAVFTLGFALTASCGGSSDTPAATGGTTTAGTSSTIGGTTASGGTFSSNGGTFSSNGGTSSATGGASSTTGGTSTGTGGFGTGGRTGTGGAATGGSTAAGGSGNAADCPASAPKTGDMCTVPASNTERCVYAGLSCRCRAPFQPGGPGGGQAGAPSTDGTFNCQGSGAACPTATPKTGDTCAGNLQCPYPGGTQCFCLNKKFQCGGGMMTGGTCPANKPADNTTACTMSGQVCNFGQGNVCVCDGMHLICGG